MTGADFLITLPEFPDKKVSIKDFGAVENQTDIAGSKRNAAAINSAMSVISNEGGGTVVIPKGIWITGPIVIRSASIYFAPARYITIKFPSTNLLTWRCGS